MHHRGTRCKSRAHHFRCVNWDKPVYCYTPPNWLTNTYNPYKPNAMLHHCFSSEAFQTPDGMREEWNRHIEWVRTKVIGPPKATESCSVQDLIGMGMVGLYAKVS